MAQGRVRTFYLHPHHSTHERVSHELLGDDNLSLNQKTSLQFITCLQTYDGAGFEEMLGLRVASNPWLHVAFGDVCATRLITYVDVYRPMSQHTTLVFRRGGTMCWDYNGLVGLTIEGVVGLSEGLFTPHIPRGSSAGPINWETR